LFITVADHIIVDGQMMSSTLNCDRKTVSYNESEWLIVIQLLTLTLFITGRCLWDLV